MAKSDRVDVHFVRFRSLAFAAPICAVALWAQAQPPAPASLAGAVTNSLTGEGIPHVHITLHNSENHHAYGAVTDAEGKFTMAPLPPDQYVVEMERAGFLMRRNPGYIGESNQIELTAGEKKDVTLKLVPGGSISGRVFDSRGEPVESISVQGEGGWSELRMVRTDDSGHYRLSGLLPGKYRVRAAPEQIPLPPEHRSDGTEELHHARTYYPGSLSSKSATRVRVQAGTETTGIDIRLIRTPIVGVRGTLAGFPKGQNSVNFQLEYEGGDTNIGGVSKPDGTFEIWRLDPGTYRLSASGGGRTGLRSAPVEIVVGDRNVEDVVLQAVAPAVIPGHITYEDESAKPKENPRLVVREVSSRFGSPHGEEEAEIDSDGSFRLEKVPAGRYMVSVSWRTAYVVSTTLGGTRFEGRVLDLSAGSVDASLTVVLSSEVAQISGTVRNDEGPVPGFAVLIPEQEGGSEFQIAMGPKGNYSFPGIAPGNYKLFALPPGEGIRQDAIMRDLEMYEDVMEHVSVGPGQKVTKDLKLTEPEG
ncbi:MAG TPA: carboxypeptidase-like regulatory domain-containing protein [Bryobacteraceae bacterium]|nr:carboxypeptidase-like regulatory domain-containing protein [Bryobacteraceae bacterium]